MSGEPQSESQAVTPRPQKKRPAHIGNFRFSAAFFLCALVLMLATSPFVELLKNGGSIDGALLTVVLGTGVLAVGRSHRTLFTAIVLVLPAVASKWINQFLPGFLPPEFHVISSLVFISFVLVQFLLFVLRAPRVNSDVLCAGIAGYLLLGMIWMMAYVLVSQFVPGSFSVVDGTSGPRGLQDFEAFYFSFITLSTVGYGDITPLSHSARTLALTEAMTGTIYIAVFISRLVALYTAQESAPQSKEPEAGGNLNPGKMDRN